MQKRTLLLTVLVAVVLVVQAIPASAYTSGTLEYLNSYAISSTFTSDGGANVLRVWTQNFWPGPGNINLNANPPVEPQGNFDPLLTLWSGTPGGGAVAYAINEDIDVSSAVDPGTQVFSYGSGFFYTNGDAGIRIENLPAGTYFVTLTLSTNAPLNGVGSPWIDPNPNDFVFYPFVYNWLYPPVDEFGDPVDPPAWDNFGYGNPNYRYTVELTTSSVPIPGSVLLLGSGLAGLLFFRRKRM